MPVPASKRASAAALAKLTPISSSPSTSLPRPRRPVALALAAALSCALPACLIEDPEPLAPGESTGPAGPADPSSQHVHTTFVVEPGQGVPPIGFFLALDRASQVEGLFTGTLTMVHAGRADLVTASGVLGKDGALRLAPGVASGHGLSLTWDELRIAVLDQDGDGVYESGIGHMSGEVSAYPFFGAVDDDFAAGPDAFTALAWVEVEGASSGDPLLPWQPIHIELQQRVPLDQATRYRVLAGNQELPGATRVPVIHGDVVTAVEFIPREFYPLGAEIHVEAGGMVNALGRPVTFEQAPLQVMSDPGPASANPGFEQGLQGWSAIGLARVVDAFGDLAPGEGASMALVETLDATYRYDSRLVGYVDVPADASELALSLAAFTPADMLPSAISVRLHHDRHSGGLGAFEVYEFGHEAESFEPCDCEDPDAGRPRTQRAGPYQRQVSLAALRGGRVFLEVHVEGREWYGLVRRVARAVQPLIPPLPPVPAAVLVDDVQIR